MTALTYNTVTVDDDDWTDGTSSMLEQWLTMYGIRPGHSSPRGRMTAHPLCAAGANWLWAL